MLDQTLAEFTVSRVQWGLEDKDNVVLLDDMLDYVSLACFQALVQVVLETESSAIPIGCLFIWIRCNQLQFYYLR